MIQHFKEPFKMHKKVTKRKHCRGRGGNAEALTLHLKVHLSVQSRTSLKAHLKICLMVYFKICINIHKKCI